MTNMTKETIEKIIKVITENNGKIVKDLKSENPVYAEQVYLNLVREGLSKLEI